MVTRSVKMTPVRTPPVSTIYLLSIGVFMFLFICKNGSIAIYPTLLEESILAITIKLNLHQNQNVKFGTLPITFKHESMLLIDMFVLSLNDNFLHVGYHIHSFTSFWLKT